MINEMQILKAVNLDVIAGGKSDIDEEVINLIIPVICDKYDQPEAEFRKTYYLTIEEPYQKLLESGVSLEELHERGSAIIENGIEVLNERFCLPKRQL